MAMFLISLRVDWCAMPSFPIDVTWDVSFTGKCNKMVSPARWRVDPARNAVARRACILLPTTSTPQHHHSRSLILA